ncbi:MULTISPECIES: ATP-binding SpoIIE family protein phosphatase [Deinococcus]|uniref:ATP-binding SpoIIE family protein phosphatase n=1 Tax=Deinococcus rufus TaxID=2136097 RepID=A0ABV7Z5X5_9DEIO|nr:ATP-binding SpoIIE family protein phosphatase [Deinococcus sp. AB2017081]WQE95531.1 ATP-binding SpoIIE family protein phosphatase [Deinococcus sp. AB2017081]
MARSEPGALGGTPAALETDAVYADLLTQVADISDQVVFLQRLIPQVLGMTTDAQAAGLVQEAAALLNTPRAALFLDGRWVGGAPGWLQGCAAPQQPQVLSTGRVYTGPPYRDAWRPTALLSVPFPRGWVALWGKRQFQAGERRLLEAFVSLLDSALQAVQARQEAEHHAAAQRDRVQARAVWRHVVPEQLDDPPGYRVEVHSQPASDFGGDFQFQERDWLVVGDVSGKGLPAAILTAMFAATLPVAARRDDLAGALSEALYRHLERAQAFCTLAALRLSPTGGVRVLNLGHPPALLRRADGTLERFAAQAPPLGTFPIEDLAGVPVWLHPGDQLLLYSDGLSEAERGDGAAETQLGLDAVQQLAHAATTPRRFITGALQALHGYRVMDDLTLLAVQRDPAQRSVTLTLPGSLDVLPDVGEALRRVGGDDHPARLGAELAVTELVVNAVVHGGATRITLRAHADADHLYVTLHDDGTAHDPTAQPTGPAGELREHGYGLLIVRRCTGVWAYDRSGPLNRQTLQFRAPAP